MLRDSMPRVVLDALWSLRHLREGLSLRRVSLSLPDHELQTVGARDAADLLAHAVANERRDVTGALLLLDVAPGSLRPHWYGVVVTARDDWQLDWAWMQLVAGTPTRQERRKRVCVVTGQSGDWGAPGRVLVRNVRRVARYAAKPLPRSAPRVPIVERVIATGVFAAPFAMACAPREGRWCERCGVSVGHKRRQARFCSATCQKLGHRARKEAA